MLRWLRQNVFAGVIAGVMTTAVIGAITGVWALPVRLSAVEEQAADNREHHDRDAAEIRARHRTDVEAITARQSGSERHEDQVVQMIQTLQRQVVSVYQLVDAQTALIVRQQGLPARDAPGESAGR